MRKQISIFFYFLSTYVILQFAWWGYHLVELSNKISVSSGGGNRRMFMIIGEGMVFFLILVLGIYRIRKSIKQELHISQTQNNFLLSITHELKTPIASTKLYLQTLQKRDFDEEKRIELISKALQENLRLEKIIDNILNASRLENRKLILHKEQMDVSAFTLSIVDRYRKIHPARLIETDIPSSLEFDIDPFIYETIVNNLIENALKYGGNETITVQLNVDNNQLQLNVKDLGIGIPDAFHKSIFKKFYRIGNEETRTEKGSGLGLFIAAEFTRLHKGQIKIQNNEPRGANFELIL